MIKEKMFIVASNIDDSIKSLTPIYEISIFPNFLEFEDYVDTTPIKLSTVIVSEKELPFTSGNMTKLLETLNAPFLKLTGSCIYLISNETPKEVVQGFVEDSGSTNIVIYQGDLSSKFIADIVSGAARLADEAETEVVTYRMRASEYAVAQNIKKYESDSDYYVTDEESLDGIPSIEEPLIFVPTVDIVTSVYYVVGKNSLERTLFTFIEAQYLSLTGKTLIMESDVKYHRLTDMVMKSGLVYEYFDIQDFMANPSLTINKIKECGNRLIVLGCYNRIYYDYDFIYDILLSNLTGWIDSFVKECDFSQTPYGSYYNIVCADTLPDVLECCNSLAYDVDEDKVMFIGIRTAKPSLVNITSQELMDVCRTLLEKDNLVGEVLEVSGINLKGDELVYDVLGLINRGNERQN